MAPPTAAISDTGSAKPLSFPRYLCSQIKTKPKPVTDVDLHGKTALVTGSNCGVGLETSRQLLDLGLSKLILAVRDEEKGREAAAELSQGRKGFDPKTIEVWKLDQCEYGSVVAFADRAKRTLRRLDIAVLNVGIYPAKRRVNAETAHDEVIQVNYISTALLAILLLPLAKRQPQPMRITFTSSETAAFTRFFPVGNPQQPIFPAMDAPGKAARNTADRMFVSKLLGQFFVAKLASVVPARVAVINAASPGSVHDSRFAREFEGSKAGAVTKICLRRFGNTAAVGARMMTDAAVRHGEETHGKFLSFQKVIRMAPIIYTKNGAMISQHLWRETMEELSFANVAEILEDVAN
ncbi:Short-chain dehydrogenase TIC 32- chloroplastic [Apiospora aurea]|uniref:Short-chain dehydrogenase TIC 32- chloroplastic n=1 Tax=Apiospora aurea TaxID=335848 RepID=A0ABR1PX48_9PEZI